MTDVFNTVVYEPIYNALAFFINLIPGGDVGLAIVAVTVLVRLVLFPISWTAIKTQMTMRKIDPILKDMREKYKENKEELARKMMELFKTNKINPFASFFLILIQLPVVIGLYLVLQNESKVAVFDPALLYSFVPVPTETTLHFLGLLNLSEKSILLALIVALSQFIFAKLMMPPVAAKKAGAESSFTDDLQRSMSLQMQYVFPVLLGVVAYATSASIALYFVVSNTFSIGQELFVRKIHNEQGNNTPNA
jgi:YidC/Oxa1 family membrane protein insertase